MKRILILILASVMLFCACAREEGVTSGSREPTAESSWTNEESTKQPGEYDAQDLMRACREYVEKTVLNMLKEDHVYDFLKTLSEPYEDLKIVLGCSEDEQKIECKGKTVDLFYIYKDIEDGADLEGNIRYASSTSLRGELREGSTSLPLIGDFGYNMDAFLEVGRELCEKTDADPEKTAGVVTGESSSSLSRDAEGIRFEYSGYRRSGNRTPVRASLIFKLNGAGCVEAFCFSASVIDPDALLEPATQTGGTTMTSETQTQTPTPTPKSEACVFLNGAEVCVGNTVKFGSYEQDNDLSNGKEEIEWLVLDIQNGKALLLSKYALDARSYSIPDRMTTWEESPLRAWLNGEFCMEAFSGGERARIAVTKLHTEDEHGVDGNDQTVVRGGNDVYDRVFVFSGKEAGAYLYKDSVPVAELAACAPTAYALARGAGADGNVLFAAWWLRSPAVGHAEILQRCVEADGWLGSLNAGEAHGVRPAIFVELAEAAEREEISADEYAKLCRDYIEKELYALTTSQEALDDFLDSCAEPQGVMARACDAVPGGEINYFMENGAYMSADQFWRRSDCLRPGFSTLKLELSAYASAPLPAFLACGPFRALPESGAVSRDESCAVSVYEENGEQVCLYEGTNNGEAFRAEIRRTFSDGQVWRVVIETRIDHNMPQEPDHTFGLWKTVKPQTCTTGGSRERVCEKCGFVQSEAMPALGHQYVEKVCVCCGDEKEGLTEEREDGFYTVLKRIEYKHGAYIPLFRLLNFAGVKINMIDKNTVSFYMKGFGRLTLNTQDLSIKDENGENPVPPAPGDVDYALFCRDNGHIFVEISSLLVQELFETHPELSMTLREDGKIELKKDKPANDAPAPYSIFLPEEKVVAFTFDDGPDVWTGQILDVLEGEDKVTFFITGYKFDKSKDYDVPFINYVRRAHEMGCEIGIHAFYHKDNIYSPSTGKDCEPEVYEREIEKLDELYRSIFGVAPQLYRPKGGNFNPKRNYGYATILWRVDSYDWKTFSDYREELLSKDEKVKAAATEKAVNEIADRILKQVQAGDIVLMHDIYSTTALAFKKVYRVLKKQGYRFVTVSELLGIDPSEHHGQYFFSTDYYGYDGETQSIRPH